MATQWGRKETIIRPPHVPMLSYTAVAMALLCTCLFVWQRFAFSMMPLQRSYMTEYIRSQVGATFNAHEGYRLLYLGGGKSKPRLAFPIDFVPGRTALPDGKIMPVALSEVASLEGYRWFYRGPEQKLADVSLHRWLRETVYEDEGLFRLFAVTLIEGTFCLAAMLWFAVPYDIRRFKQMKYGRILAGAAVAFAPKNSTGSRRETESASRRPSLGKDDADSRCGRKHSTSRSWGGHRCWQDAAHHANPAADSGARRLRYRLRSGLRIPAEVLRFKERGDISPESAR